MRTRTLLSMLILLCVPTPALADYESCKAGCEARLRADLQKCGCNRDCRAKAMAGFSRCLRGCPDPPPTRRRPNEPVDAPPDPVCPLPDGNCR